MITLIVHKQLLKVAKHIITLNSKFSTKKELSTNNPKQYA